MLGDRTSVLLLVWDATDPAPVLRDATPDAEHGRGLDLVNALAARWGYYRPNEQPYGKVVWALIRPLSKPMSSEPTLSRISQVALAPEGRRKGKIVREALSAPLATARARAVEPNRLSATSSSA